MVSLRPPAQVMRLSRLGSFHQCRLSFMRQLTRRMAREQWQFIRNLFDVDAKGVGRALYTVQCQDRIYSLVAFSHDLPNNLRSDRVIANAWDATFALFDGIPTSDDIAQLEKNIPIQEAGRVDEKVLVISRANKSVRLWNHVVESLAKGRQPDQERMKAVGYLMRTTAVYGSGKFGAIDREQIAERPEMDAPFQAELLLVYLVRLFVRDLVNHMARLVGGENSVELEQALSVQLGIGNSTGLGMAPFIINHPVLFSNWIFAKEEAIKRVRSVQVATQLEIETFLALFARNQVLIENWTTEHPIQRTKIATLLQDLTKVEKFLKNQNQNNDYPWDSLVNWFEKSLHEEAQELIVSLILEPYSHLVDDLAATMSDNNEDAFWIDGKVSIAIVRELLERNFDWAFKLDWRSEENCARVWYVSQEKLEPRLGERFQEPIADYEQPLAPARDATLAYKELENWNSDAPIAEFLRSFPNHRHTIRRALISENAPYSEIHDNTISAKMMPIDMLRAKLSFFGATNFDPKSDRWLRISMYAGAPYPEQLSIENSDFWIYPES